jgi:hypothetical protein
MLTYWHTLHHELLLAQLGADYHLETDQPVGELPRRANTVLLRKPTPPTVRFNGVFSRLSLINVMEYNSPDEAATVDTLQHLIAVGTGMALRLRERPYPNQPAFTLPGLSLWLLTPSITAELESELMLRLHFRRRDNDAPGLFTGQIGFHPVNVVVYNRALVEEDTLSLRMLRCSSAYHEDWAKILLAHPDWLQALIPLLATYTPEIWRLLMEQIQHANGPEIRWEAVAANGIDLTQVLPFLRVEDRLAGLTPEQRIAGLKPEQRIAGLKPEERVAGLKPEERVAGLTPEEMLAGLSPDVQAALLKKLQQNLPRAEQ